ncbi:MAG: TIR domain-containing protein [Tenericutes bacterium]|nr:TIR domain-containing protein [Mycoplasmatota bacterium]
MKIFISYHLKDSKQVGKIKQKLKDSNISFFSVDENTNFEGYHHNHIRQILFDELDTCDILLCVIGNETYSRSHVDNEIHHALKGGLSKRLGVVAVMLENRYDSISSINYNTFPRRLKKNLEYIVILQNSSLFDNIHGVIKKAIEKKNNINIQVNNNEEPMKLRQGKYYQ